MPRKTKEPTFEEALEQLESLVEAMEAGDIALADLVEKYEQGNKLLQTCQKRLQHAEMKIQQLKKQDGELSLEEAELPEGGS